MRSVLPPECACQQRLHRRFLAHPDFLRCAIKPLHHAMPVAHDQTRKFRLPDHQAASEPWPSMLACRHVNKGGTCLGPDLEAEHAGSVRRVCFRRRDLAGGILEFRIHDDANQQVGV